MALEVGSSNHSYECFNCSPYRFITSGTLVPEPSSAAARAAAACLALGTTAFARRPRRRDGTAAQ
jgi:hypothetical protein